MHANVTDIDGKLVGWFDVDKAMVWNESTFDHPHEDTPIPTRIPWEHETLYLTATSRWVLYSWNDKGMLPPCYRYVDDKEACHWLMLNEYHESVEFFFGQPPQESGPSFTVTAHIYANLLAQIDTIAKAQKSPRWEVLNEVLLLGLVKMKENNS